MKIVSWNCKNGLNEIKANSIQENFPDTDIIVIQECKRSDIYTFKNTWKFKNWYGDDREYSDLGIAIFSKKYDVEFSDVLNRKYRYVIPYNIKAGNDFSLLIVWTKPVPFYYDENLTEAIKWYESEKLLLKDTIIIGDFNTGYTVEHPERYSNLCNNLKGFNNCASKENKTLEETFYSFSKNKLYINDFCFASEGLFGKLKEIKIHKEWEVNSYGQKTWNGSDHCPISVEFDIN